MMIDYDKLKIAHDIIDKIDDKPRYVADIDMVWDRLEKKLIKYKDMEIGQECSFTLPERYIETDMIDYDKLKLAHELADKLESIDWEIYFRKGKGQDYYFRLSCSFKRNHDFDEEYSTIDELISKLQELTQVIKTKYRVGQFIWVLMSDNKHYQKKILYEKVNEYGQYYDVTDLD